MTTLYLRATGNGQGLHVSPTAGSGEYYSTSGAMYDGEDLIGLQWTFAHVTGATSTWTGTAIVSPDDWLGATKTLTSVNYTPSAQTVSGGTALKVTVDIIEDGWDSIGTYTFYSGPLVATGISSTQWTCEAYAQRISEYGYFYYNTSASKIDGITLTGTPTSIRLNPHNSPTHPYNNTTWTVRGSWDSSATLSTWCYGLGPKTTAISTWDAEETSATNPYRIARQRLASFPFVQDASVSSTQAVWPCAESAEAANAHMMVHAAVVTAPTGTLVGTLINNQYDADEATVFSTYTGYSVTDTQSVSISAGNILLVEFGGRLENSDTTLYALKYRQYGTSDDITVDEVSSTKSGWIELTLSSGSSSTVTSVRGDISSISGNAVTVTYTQPNSTVTSVKGTISPSGLVSIVTQVTNTVLLANAPPSPQISGNEASVSTAISSSISTIVGNTTISGNTASASSTATVALSCISGSISTTSDQTSEISYLDGGQTSPPYDFEITYDEGSDSIQLVWKHDTCDTFEIQRRVDDGTWVVIP